MIDPHAALLRRYTPPEWALFFEVANATGSNGRRYADALAMNLFPSKGLTIEGFEIKASRSDFLRELKEPWKAEESWFPRCDRWWIVIADPAIVKKDELPPTWGLLAPRGDELFAVKPAPLLEGVQPIGRPELAALLRRATEQPPKVIEARLQEARKQARAQGEEHAAWELKHLREGMEKLTKTVVEFEAASGIELQSWMAGGHAQELGEKVKRFMKKCRYADGAKDLEHARNQCRAAVRTLTDELVALGIEEAEGASGTAS